MNWTAASTIVALALGLTSIWFGYLLPARRERASARRAALEVGYEYYWRRDLGRMQERLVIRNRGPHAAADVDITELRDIGDQPLDWQSATVTPVLPASVLQPLQDHHVIMEWTINNRTPSAAIIRWHDGDGPHAKRFALSPKYL